MRWITTILIFLSFAAWSQKYADPVYYLVDSLDLSELSTEDKRILQSSLEKFHSSKQDTGRVKALQPICEELSHDDWMKYQQYQYELIKKALKSPSSKSVEKELKKSLADALNNLGYIADLRGDVIKSQEYHYESLKVSSQINYKFGKARSLNQLGVLYEAQGEKDMALDHYKRSLAISKDLGDKLNTAISYNNIGVVYSSQKKYEKALEYYLKSLKIKEELGDEAAVAMSLQNIGSIYGKLGNDEDALEYLNRGIAISERIHDKIGISRALIRVGEIELGQDHLQDAKTHLERALNLSKESGAPEWISESAFNLSRVYERLNLDAQALETYKLHVKMRDSLFSNQIHKEAVTQQVRFEYDKQKAIDDINHEKKLAIEVEEKEKQRILVFAASFGLVLVFIFLVYAYRKLQVTRQQKRTIEAQKKVVDEAYVEIEREKEKSEELLLNILPEEVAEELKEKGSAEARLMDNVTVLFTDFKGFTALSEQLSAKELVSEINTCFSAFDKIMEQHNVEKIKTIGDAYMAAGGLPVPNKTHAQDVVRAALDIQSYMLALAEEKKKENKPYFEIRIGVHTGSVVAGIVGVKKFQYDIWGDTVNTASRMESSGGVGKVNISASTYVLIKDQQDFKFESRGEIEAKGKGKLEMFFVEKNKED